MMTKPRNPGWGYWNVDWSDPREAADALGEGYYRGRRTQWETSEEELPDGFHIEEDMDDNEPWHR